VRCRYKAPAHYDDAVVVRTQLRKLRGPLVHFAYDIVRDDDQTLLAEAETVHIAVNSRMEKRLLPTCYEKAFEAGLA
jgi:acyl-CoA thioester hydrolase